MGTRAWLVEVGAAVEEVEVASASATAAAEQPARATAHSRATILGREADTGSSG